MNVRVIDTGLRGARENVAIDQALIESRAAGAIPDTIRFLRFRPSALIGLHQILGHEVRREYCRAQGIEVARRITGGGGLYMDPGQLGWELVLDRRRFGTTDLAGISARICQAAAAGLRRLGVPAEYRPRNDIEAGGRKLGGTGGFVDGNTLFYQGTLLLDFDPARMIEVLKIPVEKLARRELDDARKRVTSLRQLLGAAPPDAAIVEALLAGFREGLGFETGWGEISAAEEALAAQHLREEIGTDEFVHRLDAPEPAENLVSATHFPRGGMLRADIRLEDPARGRIREALITGDFFITPPRALYDLEAALRGLPVTEAGAAAEAFFARPGCGLVGLTPADFRELVDRALGQLTLRAAGRTLRGHWRGARAAAGPAPKLPVLVFLHDALGSTRLWRDFPDKLCAATGLRALVYDRWGSGDSEPLAPPWTCGYLLHEALESLPQVLEACGVADAILVGQSDGASIALAFAGLHPAQVRGVIALSPHLFREDKTLQAIRAQIADFAHGDLRERLRRHHGAKTDALFARLVEVWTAGDGDWGLAQHLRGIRCPVLAIRGEDDEFFSTAQLDALAALVPGLRQLRLPGCGHYPHLQATRPVFQAAARFLLELHSATVANEG